jgi:Fe-S cluster biogenesis protein NfuA
MYPTTLYAELTPNPNTMKFVADRTIFPQTEPVEYLTAVEAKGSSELATQLFNFPFVKSVFIAHNFVTVTKTADMSWDYITFELREFLREYLVKTEHAIEVIPEPRQQQDEPASKTAVSRPKALPSEYDEEIIKLLDEYVKPAVESDGGAIDFVSFYDGVVTVQLRGSCSGCPSSTVTLKNGIEQLLTTEMPVVKEVVAESV